MGVGGSTISPLDEEEESRTSEPAPGATLVRIGIFQVNPVTKTGQRLYMMHMLLLPFLPITALIVQNSTTLNNLLQYQRDVASIGRKVDGATLLEKFITNMQRERAEVAFYIFTNGSQTLEMNLTTRFRHTDATLESLSLSLLTTRFRHTDATLEKMPWPERFERGKEDMFKSKLRFQIRHEDFRQRISQPSSRK